MKSIGKKVLAFILLTASVITVAGCDFDIYLQKDSIIDSTDYALEVFPLYAAKVEEYVSGLFEDYTVNIIITDNRESENYDDSAVLIAEFTLSKGVYYALQIGSTISRPDYQHRIIFNSLDNFSDFDLVKDKCFELMYKVDQLCCYKLKGDIDCYYRVYSEAVASYYSGREIGHGSYNYSNLNWLRYACYFKFYNEWYDIGVTFAAYLSDEYIRNFGEQ